MHKYISAYVSECQHVSSYDCRHCIHMIFVLTIEVTLYQIYNNVFIRVLSLVLLVSIATTRINICNEVLTD